MGKVIALSFIVLLALASLICFVSLTMKIAAGELKIAEGQQQLANGQQMLAEGKAKLANGKQRLSGAKKVYGTVNTVFLFGIVSKLPITSLAFKDAKKQINDGQDLIAKGESNIKSGEGRLAAGKLQLQQGEERLSVANKIRIACGFGTVLFGTLSIVLGYYWRRSKL